VPIANELVEQYLFQESKLFFLGSEATLAQYRDISSGEVPIPGGSGYA
jgi:hypothetical protein